ncbi:hypothetical protein HO345_04505 [Treponema denticola]|uniref:DUF456 domain-containing protein n=1 Tax=Treponema TaxID=157 RepID=UPI0020A387D7|nr:DUF456 domain-containing protein [Treponema denticola]UTD12290.1 hypothetical protein HO345_04505 [Treponema denticola]
MSDEQKQKRGFEKEIEVAISKELEKYAEANADFLQMHSDLKNLNPNRGGNKGHGGFVFERVEKAKRNAESHIKGGTKVVELTDTLAENGNQNFSVNDTNSDLVSLSKDGNIVSGSGEQLKAYGKQTTKSAVRDVMNGKEGNINRYDTITVPKDRYDATLQEIDNYIEKSKNEGNEKGVEELKKLKKKIKKGTADTKDIVFADKHKNIYTAKEIAKTANKAGLQAAGTSSAIQGGISSVLNLKAVANGEKTANEAIKDITVETAKTAGESYLTAAGASALGGALKQSSTQIIKNLGKGSGPMVIVNSSKILAKNTIDLIKGKISVEKYIKNIGKEGAALGSSVVGSNIGAIAGTLILPGIGTAIGTFIGSVLGSIMSNITYGQLVQTMELNRLSDEQRKQIEEYCKTLIEEELYYRERINNALTTYLNKKEKDLTIAFNNISYALQNNQSLSLVLQRLSDILDLDVKLYSEDEVVDIIINQRNVSI